MVHELVEGLLARGHEVSLFATGDSRTRAELHARYPEAQWPPDVLTDLDHVSWALQQVARGEFDIVHAHSAVALAMGRMLPRIPLVYTLHHERDERLSTFYHGFTDAYYVAISDAQRRREIPLPRCTVIHHGLNPEHFRWTERPQEYLCFIGRLARVKGPHTAIDVANRAGLPIRVAGEVHEVDQEFGAREVEPRLALPHVRYLGNIGMDQKVPLLLDAGHCWLPSSGTSPSG